jgi:hypothetical protein
LYDEPPTANTRPWASQPAASQRAVGMGGRFE